MMREMYSNRTVPFAATFLALLTTLYAGMAYAGAPGTVWLTFPENPSEEMIVSWKFPTEEFNTVVEFGLTPGYGQTANVEAKESVGADVGWVYHARLTGLQAGKLYHYRIGVGGEFTNDYNFRTSPADPCETFSFITMGDNRGQLGGSALGSSFLSAAMSVGPAFMVNTGDLVTDGSETNQWVEYLNDINTVSGFVPIMPVIGNHDDGPGNGNSQNITRIFRTPKNNPDENRSYYSFEYGNAFFAVVTNHDGSSEDQADWLHNQLQATDALWKFVFVHEPFFTCPALFGLLGHEPDESDVFKYYGDVFRINHVDMVFTGHNHMYELFNPHNGSAFVNDPAQGTMHVTTGGAAEAEALIMLIEPALFCIRPARS